MAKRNVGTAIGGGTIVLDTETGRTSVQPFTPVERGSGGSGSSRSRLRPVSAPTPLPEPEQIVEQPEVSQPQNSAQQRARERQREISRERDRLLRQGGSVSRRIVGRDSETGERITQDIIRRGSKTIIQTEKGGVITLREIGLTNGGGTPQDLGGVIIGAAPSSILLATEVEPAFKPVPTVGTGTVTIAPTILGRFGRTIDDAGGLFGGGLISGTISFISSEAQRLEDIRQQKTGDVVRGAEQSRGVALAAEVGTFVAAPLLFVGRGIETLASGKADEEARQLQAQGVGRIESGVVAFGQPVLDIVLGGSSSKLLRTSIKDVPKIKIPKDKRGSLGSLESTGDSGFIEINGRFIKKADLGLEISKNIKKFTPDQVKDFVTTQVKNINKLDISQAQKIRKVQDLQNIVLSARAENIALVDGRVVPFQSAGSIKIGEVIKPPKITDFKPQSQQPQSSIFAGTGQFERTDMVGSRIAQVQGQGSGQQNLIRSDSALRSNQRSIQLLSPQLRVAQSSFSRQVERTSQISRTNQLQSPSQISLLRSDTAQVSRLRQRLQQRNVQQSALRQRTRLRQRQQTRIIAPPFPRLGNQMLQSLSQSTKTEKFKVFVRTAGQDVEIATKKSQPAAIKVLKAKLKGTISASGFIEQNGKRLKFTELGIKSPEFRPSTLNPFTVVQRKTKRLSTGGETQAIQFFRQSSKRRSRSTNIFGI